MYNSVINIIAFMFVNYYNSVPLIALEKPTPFQQSGLNFFKNNTDCLTKKIQSEFHHQ